MNNVNVTSDDDYVGGSAIKKSIQYQKRRSAFGKFKFIHSRIVKEISKNWNNDSSSNTGLNNIKYRKNFFPIVHCIKYADKNLCCSKPLMERTMVTKLSKSTSTDNDNPEFVYKQFQSLFSESVRREINAANYMSAVGIPPPIRTLLKAVGFRPDNKQMSAARMTLMAELFDSENEDENENDSDNSDAEDDFEDYEDETDDDYDKIVMCKNNLIKVIRQNGDNINFEETNLHDENELDDDDDEEDNSEVESFTLEDDLENSQNIASTFNNEKLSIKEILNLSCDDNLTDEQINTLIRSAPSEIKCFFEGKFPDICQSKFSLPSSSPGKSYREFMKDCDMLESDTVSSNTISDEALQMEKYINELKKQKKSTNSEGDENVYKLLMYAIGSGWKVMVEFLLARYPKIDINNKYGKEGITPLMEAARHGHDKIVSLLISHSADINTKSSTGGNTPLMLASAFGKLECVTELVEHGANIELQNENGHTALMEAASSGHYKVVRYLFTCGASINVHSNEYKETALTLAAYKGHTDIVRFLIEMGEDLTEHTEEMHTALMEASMDGHVDVARLLLDSGAQVNMPPDSFESPLTLAACGGHVELALLLIERGANIEEVNDEGFTALMEASRESHEEMVALLLSHGAEVNATTGDCKETALSLACGAGAMEVVNLLIKAGANLELGANTPLIESAQEGHCNLVKILLEAGANINATNISGETALAVAAENGNIDVVKLLISSGADVDYYCGEGRTPLMKAAQNGRVEIVSLLITKAKINTTTPCNDNTALSLACANGHAEVANMLLHAGADLNHRLKDNSTMIIEAAKNGHANVLEVLYKHCNICTTPIPVNTNKTKTNNGMATKNNNGMATKKNNEMATKNNNYVRPRQTAKKSKPPMFEHVKQKMKLSDEYVESMRKTKGAKGSSLLKSRPTGRKTKYVSQLNKKTNYILSKTCKNVAKKMMPQKQQPEERKQVAVKRGSRNTIESDYDSIDDDDDDEDDDGDDDDDDDDDYDDEDEEEDDDSVVSEDNDDNDDDYSDEIEEENSSDNLKNIQKNDINNESISSAINPLIEKFKFQCKSIGQRNTAVFGEMIGAVFFTLFHSFMKPTCKPFFADDVLFAEVISDLNKLIECKSIEKEDREWLEFMMKMIEIFKRYVLFYKLSVQDLKNMNKTDQKEMDNTAIFDLDTIVPGFVLQKFFDNKRIIKLFNINENYVKKLQDLFSRYDESFFLDKGEFTYLNLDGTEGLEKNSATIEIGQFNPQQMIFFIQNEDIVPIGYLNDMLFEMFFKLTMAFLSYEKEQLFSQMLYSVDLDKQLTNTMKPLITSIYDKLKTERTSICSHRSKNKVENGKAMDKAFKKWKLELDSEQLHKKIHAMVASEECTGTNIKNILPNSLKKYLELTNLNDLIGRNTSDFSPEQIAILQDQMIASTMFASYTTEIRTEDMLGPCYNLADSDTLIECIPNHLDEIAASMQKNNITAADLAANFPRSENIPKSFIELIKSLQLSGYDPGRISLLKDKLRGLGLFDSPKSTKPSSTNKKDNTKQETNENSETSAASLIDDIAIPTAWLQNSKETVSWLNEMKNIASDLNRTRDDAIRILNITPVNSMEDIYNNIMPEPDFIPKLEIPANRSRTKYFSKKTMKTDNIQSPGSNISNTVPIVATVSTSTNTTSTVRTTNTATENIETKTSLKTNNITSFSIAKSNLKSSIKTDNNETSDKIAANKNSIVIKKTANGANNTTVLFKNKPVDLNTQTDSNHDTALTLACSAGYEDSAKFLLSNGANIEHREKKGLTPLMLAATSGHAKTVELLLLNGAELEAQTERTKDTALSLACSSGKYEVVEILLSNGANKEHRNVSDYTPLSLAASGGYVSIINLLLSYGAEINSRTGSKLGISPLMLAAMNGHTETAKILLDKGSDINAYIETNKNTALTLACFQGRAEVVSLLVDRNANIEHRAKNGLTPLMEAASGGYVEVGKVLLEKGAEVNAAPVPSSRDTALTIAADKGHSVFVELLIKYNVNVDAKNKKGYSALWLACNGGHYDVANLLINAKCDLDAQDNRKITCLMAAFRKGHVKLVKLMVRNVSQFPSDQEIDRFLGICTDEELKKKVVICSGIVRLSKERQAAEALKNAANLLEEIDLERLREENRKAAAARRRERRKQKKKEKAGKNSNQDDENENSKSADKDDASSCMAEDDDFMPEEDLKSKSKDEIINDDKNDKSDNVDEENITEEYVENFDSTSIDDKQLWQPEVVSIIEDKKIKKKKKSSGNNENNNNNNNNSNSNNGVESNLPPEEPEIPKPVETELKKEKKMNKKERASSLVPTPTPSLTNNNTTNNTNGNKNKNRNDWFYDERRTEPNTGFNNNNNHNTNIVNNSKVKKNDEAVTKTELLINKTLDTGSKLKTSDSHNINESLSTNTTLPINQPFHLSYKNYQSTNFRNKSFNNTKRTDSGNNNNSNNNNNKTSGDMKREEGWKEVVRKSKKVVVPANAISRVIGRGGCNINTIRETSNAHIEVEKQKGQGDRMVIIRGSAESTRIASQLIDILSKEDKDLAEIIRELGLTKPANSTGPVSGTNDSTNAINPNETVANSDDKASRSITRTNNGNGNDKIPTSSTTLPITETILDNADFQSVISSGSYNTVSYTMAVNSKTRSINSTVTTSSSNTNANTNPNPNLNPNNNNNNIITSSSNIIGGKNGVKIMTSVFKPSNKSSILTSKNTTNNQAYFNQSNDIVQCTSINLDTNVAMNDQLNMNTECSTTQTTKCTSPIMSPFVFNNISTNSQCLEKINFDSDTTTSDLTHAISSSNLSSQLGTEFSLEDGNKNSAFQRQFVLSPNSLSSLSNSFSSALSINTSSSQPNSHNINNIDFVRSASCTPPLSNYSPGLKLSANQSNNTISNALMDLFSTDSNGFANIMSKQQQSHPKHIPVSNNDFSLFHPSNMNASVASNNNNNNNNNLNHINSNFSNSISNESNLISKLNAIINPAINRNINNNNNNNTNNNNNMNNTSAASHFNYMDNMLSYDSRSLLDPLQNKSQRSNLNPNAPGFASRPNSFTTNTLSQAPMMNNINQLNNPSHNLHNLPMPRGSNFSNAPQISNDIRQMLCNLSMNVFQNQVPKHHQEAAARLAHLSAQNNNFVNNDIQNVFNSNSINDKYNMPHGYGYQSGMRTAPSTNINNDSSYQMPSSFRMMSGLQSSNSSSNNNNNNNNNFSMSNYDNLFGLSANLLNDLPDECNNSQKPKQPAPIGTERAQRKNPNLSLNNNSTMSMQSSFAPLLNNNTSTSSNSSLFDRWFDDLPLHNDSSLNSKSFNSDFNDLFNIDSQRTRVNHQRNQMNFAEDNSNFNSFNLLSNDSKLFPTTTINSDISNSWNDFLNSISTTASCSTTKPSFSNLDSKGWNWN